ncbi:MAG: DegT/DnrJ/EryC1/StrS family aminotransferase [Clostridiales bacterium]|jgi:dTDP-4-amino-4,6-dideoxygalactose transaminase|nr:DegT/DnrJ/EryC1/StrS family aminotransferase [Eubacteriales bacterium]MDH7567677.1 DegT/DnrJ/EryC1/StrS family aminotransferase [Clostridiales bacterium]
MSTVEPFARPVYVTAPLLPDLTELKAMLEAIWENRQLTNNGKMARLLERELAAFLRVQHLSLFSNGTTALQLACRVLRLHGEVITTPFTFAATSHALYWNGLKPVFCDIEEETFTMDPQKIEDLISPETTAIMPVHVFGNPCRTEEIEGIAQKHGLKVIYDAAHAFGVEVGGKPIGAFGDISAFSFHATKIYHTIEGGALAFNNPYLKERADALRNFGIKSEESVTEPGINGKLNEIQAAIGLLLLKSVPIEIERRKEITYLYRNLLQGVPGISFGKDLEGVTHNYPYFVIQINGEEFGITRDQLHEKLKEYNIFTRKYFYPLCSHFPCYRNLPSADKHNLPVAERIAEQVLSLPLYGSMENEDVEKICDIIKSLRDM